MGPRTDQSPARLFDTLVSTLFHGSSTDHAKRQSLPWKPRASTFLLKLLSRLHWASSTKYVDYSHGYLWTPVA